MNYSSFSGLALPLVLLLNACAQEVPEGAFRDGISIKTLVRNSKYIEIRIKSDNPEYDCINENGINGSGEELNGNSQESIVISDVEYGKSDISYFDNRTEDKIIRIGDIEKIIQLKDVGYTFIMFPVFNCGKFQENIPHKVYIYTKSNL